MRYVPARWADPDAPCATPATPATPAGAARRAMQELRVEAERRAWAGRTLLRGAAPRAGVRPGGVPAEQSERLAGLLAELRGATARYVCALRADGARPEQMLVSVKAFVRDAMTAEGWQDPDAVQALTAEVVGWSIAAYYDR